MVHVVLPGRQPCAPPRPEEYIDKYKGKFDDGYEAYREWVLPRMIEKGILPEGTQLTPINPMPDDMSNPGDLVRPWDSLNADEKRLFSRLAEVYAGFSEYTDAQVGRIIDYLEKTGQLENTLVIYAADNGASGEGSPNGSVNENKFFNSYPDELSENLKYIDVLGSPDTYEHYPTGWAAAFSTPFQMFKRYSQYSGGTCDPLVISWPKGIKAQRRGPQPVPPLHRHRADDPGRLRAGDAQGVQGGRAVPAVRGVDALQLRRQPSADPEAAPVLRDAGHARHLGGRLEGQRHPRPAADKGHFDKDQWELYHVDEDRAEAKDVAQQHPDKLQALIKAWFEEADKNLVLPLDDRAALELLNIERPTEEPPRERYMYYPGTSPVPEGVAVNVRGRSFKILADVEIKDPSCAGVIFAHGSRFGGHALFIKDKKLYYVYNFLGIKPEQQFVSSELKPGKYVLGVEFTREGPGPATNRWARPSCTSTTRWWPRAR